MSNISLTIDKHNTLTDTLTGNISMYSEKLINIIYYYWQEYKKNKLIIEFIDLKKKLNMSSEDYIARITNALIELTNPISIRVYNTDDRFSYKKVSFIKELSIWKDKKKYVSIEINKIFLDAFGEKRGFTSLDINVCNQFRTKYGLHIYYMYKRYEKLPNKLFPNKGYILFGLDDLNKRFGTNFKTKSELKRSIDRGTSEIHKLTGIKITVLWQPMHKKFSFSWIKVRDKELWRVDLRKFITYMRKNFVNVHLITGNVNNKVTLVSIAPNGHLYDLQGLNKIDAKTSKRVWEWMFENQNKIDVIKDNFKEDFNLLIQQKKKFNTS